MKIYGNSSIISDKQDNGARKKKLPEPEVLWWQNPASHPRAFF